MLHQIGVGALGPVFRTYEPTRDRLVAVKVFRLDVIPEQARTLADELERAATAELFHPSIVEPVAAGVEGTVAYRAEEYVAAESLDVAMRHYAPATVEKVLPFITQLASAIDFARTAGVGHGALHPRDIFVTPDEARATGFGVVDALERVGLRAPVRRPYSPPERIAGQPWQTSADVFSLAAIAFELLTGRRPSGLGDDMGSLAGSNLGAQADAIRAVLARAMHENAAERFQTGRAFSAALAAAAGLEEVQVSLAEQPLRVSRVAPVGMTTSSDDDLRLAPDTQNDKAELPTELPLVAQLAPLATSTPAASDILLKGSIAAATPSLTDLTAAGADLDGQADVLTSLNGADDALDDFGPEPDGLLGESPRELARKVIAAREVRKRQGKKKPDVKMPEAFGDPTSTPVDARAVALPAVASVGLFGADPEPVAAASSAPGDGDRHEVVPAESDENTTPASPSLLAPPSVIEVTPSSYAMPEGDPEAPLVAEVSALEPVELHARDFSDRVVAVDEFRAREAQISRDAQIAKDKDKDAQLSKSERPWPRVPERPAAERTLLLDRSDRGVTPRLSSESIESELPPPPVEESTWERQRLMMLPSVLILGLGLMLGYAAGYVRGSREAAATIAATGTPPVRQAAASEPQQTATTGTSAARETTDVGITPPAKPATPVDVPPAAAAKPPAAKATPAPVATPPPAPKRPAATAGKLVITSSPSKAAVTVNGKWSGRTPLTLEDVKFGNYAVRVVQPGYEVAREQVALSASSASHAIDVVLRRTAGAPAARTSAPPVAENPKPVAPATKQAALPPAVPPLAAPAAATTGELRVDSRPQGARVFIDGKDLGFTPLRLTAHPVGTHTVRLELANHQPWTSTTTVSGQTPAHVNGSLEPIR